MAKPRGSAPLGEPMNDGLIQTLIRIIFVSDTDLLYQVWVPCVPTAQKAPCGAGPPEESR